MSNQPMLMMMQAAPAGQSSGTTGLLVGILPWVLIFGIFYILMIRPQQQRVKQHQASINAVKKGDEVITGGGIRGRVTKVNDEEAEVEIAQGVKIRVVKSTISQVLTPNTQAGERLMLEFPRWKIWLIGDRHRDRRRLLSIPSLIAGTPACGAAGPSGCRSTRSALASTSPAAATCCSRPMRTMRRSSGSRRWRTRSRPSFAAIRRSTSATFRPRAVGFSFLVRNPTQVDAAVERMRNLTTPVALTGNRDWDVQVVDSTRSS